jgi:hypothetical protein
MALALPVLVPPTRRTLGCCATNTPPARSTNTSNIPALLNQTGRRSRRGCAVCPRRGARGRSFWGWLVGSRIHLIFLDAFRGITTLSEVLLFRAVAHHFQMDNKPGLFGVFLGVLRLGFVGHRGIPCVNDFGFRSRNVGRSSNHSADGERQGRNLLKPSLWVWQTAGGAPPVLVPALRCCECVRTSLR